MQHQGLVKDSELDLLDVEHSSFVDVPAHWWEWKALSHASLTLRRDNTSFFDRKSWIFP